MDRVWNVCLTTRNQRPLLANIFLKGIVAKHVTSRIICVAILLISDKSMILITFRTISNSGLMAQYQHTSALTILCIDNLSWDLS